MKLDSLIVFIVFLLVMPFSFALNCTAVSLKYQPDCRYVLNSGIGEKEKEYLINSLISEKNYPSSFTSLSKEKAFSPPTFSLELSKLTYWEGELVQGRIFPSQAYLVAYAGEEYSVTDNFSFLLLYPYNRIIVKEKDSFLYQTIHLWNRQPLIFFFSLSLFGIANYVLFEFIKRYRKKLI